MSEMNFPQSMYGRYSSSGSSINMYLIMMDSCLQSSFLTVHLTSSYLYMVDDPYLHPCIAGSLTGRDLSRSISIADLDLRLKQMLSSGMSRCVRPNSCNSFSASNTPFTKETRAIFTVLMDKGESCR